MVDVNELREDYEFEYAKSKGAFIEVRQNNFRVYSGKITAYSSDHVAVNGKKILRSVNQFIVVE